MVDDPEPAARPRRLDPARVEILAAVSLGIVLALVVLILFPGLVMTVLDIVAEVIGRATGGG